MRFGGVILCGGQSKRMGTPKPWLSFGGQSLLARVAQTLSGSVQPIVVVAAVDQDLPPLAGEVLIARDRAADRGPLEGIAVALAALDDRADAAFLCSCDAALLSPVIVRGLCGLLGDYDAVAPIVGGYRQSLISVCRTSALPEIEAMLEGGERKVYPLFDRVRSRFVEEDEFRTIDPDLKSVRAMNTREEYLAALAAAGFAD
jgi:molybdopterin-guanine dinucleotide biosynthesis protein A